MQGFRRGTDKRYTSYVGCPGPEPPVPAFLDAGVADEAYFVIRSLFRSDPMAPKAEFSASEVGAYQYLPLSDAQFS